MPTEHQKLADADKQLSLLAGRLEEGTKTLAALDHETVRLESQMESMNEDLAKMDGRHEMLVQELAQLRQQNETSARDHAQLLRTIDELQAAIETLRADIGVREGDNLAEQQKRDDMRERITDYRVSLNSVDESLQIGRAHV